MNEKLLSKLEPKLTENTLVFDCPVCKPGDPHGFHKIRIGFNAEHHLGNGTFWNKTGDTVATLTVTPSIDGTPNCKFHGHITGGRVTWP